MENDPITAQLASADPAVRAAAALEVAAARDESKLALLVERLPAESEIEVVAAVLKAIGVLGSARELALLAQYIDHADGRVRATVIEALFGLNTPVALPLIIPFLVDPDQRVRQTAALVIHKLGPERALKVLQSMLASPHVWMRSAATTALGLFDAQVAVPLLEKCLQDPNAKVQDRAALALRRFSRKTLKAVTKTISKAAVRKVLKATSQPNLRKLTRKVEALEHPPLPPKGQGVADAAALGISQPAVAIPLAKAPRDAGLSRIDAVIASRDASALARMVEELTGDEDRFVTARLLSAIGILDEQSFVPTLLSHLTHPDARVASNAVWALARLKERSARDAVMPLLRSMQPRLRANAILYFADQPDVDVRAPLEEMIRSADVQTRLSGLFCLAELSRPELLPLAELIEWKPEDAALKATVRARLVELEKRGIASAHRVRETVDAAPMRAAPPALVSAPKVVDGPATVPIPGLAPGTAAPAKVNASQSASPKAGRSAPPPSEGTPTGTLVPVSRRRWKTFLLVARALATATDAAVIFVPILCAVLLLESLAGGLPSGITPIAFFIGLALFIARDLPGGPGVGKRLLGLAIVGPRKGLAQALVMRQAPVLIVPWGLAELWAALSDGRGQRPTDVKHGLEVVPKGTPLLAWFAAVWFFLFALLTFTYAFVTSRPLAPDGLFWTLKTGFRPRATTSPTFVASVEPEPAPARSDAAVAALVAPAGRWEHPTMGLSIPIPAGWAISAAGSAWLEMRPKPGSATTTGAITLEVPGEGDSAPDLPAWGGEMARRFNANVTREGLRLTGWTPANGLTALGGTKGPLYQGTLLGGGEVTVFVSGRLAKPLGVSCRVLGERGMSRRLVDTLVKDCRATPSGGDWRAYRSPFLALEIHVPQAWAVTREDRTGVELHPGVVADAAWIRLDPGRGHRTPAERIAAVHKPAWELLGFEVMRSYPFELGAKHARGTTCELKSRAQQFARFRLAWIDGPAPCWAAEWMDREASVAQALEEVVAGLRRTS